MITTDQSCHYTDDLKDSMDLYECLNRAQRHLHFSGTIAYHTDSGICGICLARWSTSRGMRKSGEYKTYAHGQHLDYFDALEHPSAHDHPPNYIDSLNLV